MPDDEGLREELAAALREPRRDYLLRRLRERIALLPPSEDVRLIGQLADALAADGTEPHPAHRHDETGAGRG